MSGRVTGAARTGRPEAMRWLAGVAAVAAAFAVAGCGGTEATGGTSASGIVPAGVPAFVSINTDPDSSQWDTLDRLASRFPDKQKAVDAAKKELRKEGFDWEHDLKPALGPEVDLVWLDFASGGENVVGLMQPDDDGAFKRAIEHANAKDPSEKAYYEKFRGWTLVAPKRSLLDRFERMADTADETLDEDSAFTRAMKSTPDEALAKAYVDGRKVMAAIEREVTADQRDFVRRLGSLDWAASSLAASSDGIALDITVHGTPGKLFGKTPTGSAFDPKLPDVVPKDTLFYLTFHGTKNMFRGLENNPTLSTPELAPVFDVLADIGTLFQGENALYMRPASGSIPEITLITEPKKGVSGRATLNRILKKYALDLGVLPTSGRVAGVKTNTLDFGAFGIHYADVDGKFVVTDTRAGIANLEHPGKPLAANDTYKDALETSGMPSKTHGFLYVDIRAGTGLVEKLSGQRLPAEVSRNLKPLRSAVEYAVSRQHQLSVRFFLRIK